MSRLQNPWPDQYKINPGSPFGYRIHPITKKRKFHHGVDVAGSFPVAVPADGKVIKVGWSPFGGGHTVLIDHGDLVTVYYHGAHRTGLKVGQQVKTGEFIYQSGNTGNSTGAHLHFETRRPGGAWGDTMDPEDFLPSLSQKPQDAVSQPGGSDGTDAPDDSESPSQRIVAAPSKPSLLNRVSPALKVWHQSWMKRGEK